jgi:ABC-type antimicrobial peptide transport system ATPase subunit
MTPSLLRVPSGCAFRTRCARATEACQGEPPFRRQADGSALCCFHPLDRGASASRADLALREGGAIR